MWCYRNLIQCYELTWRQVCLLKEDISKAVQLAGERCGSNISCDLSECGLMLTQFVSWRQYLLCWL